MSVPQSFLDRVTAEIVQQMDYIAALADQLVRQPLPADAQACAAGVAESAASVRRMLDAAADIQLAEQGRLSLCSDSVRLSDLMDELQERWRERGIASGVAILASYDGPPDAAVTGDRARIAQIFDGLIAEGLHGASRGVVEAGLKARILDGVVELEGRIRINSGAGWRGADASIEEMTDHIGLQPAFEARLSRTLLGLLRGRMHAEPGVGAGQTLIFDLSLPTAEQAPQAPAPNAGRPAHVLVVDDNATNRMVAQALCEMFACTSESAVDGLEAVDMAASGRFDLILMDIRMPRMDGVAAARAIRALQGPVSTVPIVALTANADAEDVGSYMAAGMNSVVEKPMKAEHLLAALQQALEPEAVRIAS